MRLAILGSRGIPAQYGGFETFTEEVSLRLVTMGFEVTVVCQSEQKRDTYCWENATDVVRNAYLGYFGRMMNGSRFQLKKCLERGAAQS